ncbi:MAG: hypothetical protein ACRYFX_30525 [Janthinobacterium lividum]
MRRFLGYLLALVGLGFLVLLFLRLWNIAPINWDAVVRVFLTLLLLLAGVLLLAAVRYLFFKELPSLRSLTGRRNAPDETPY